MFSKRPLSTPGRVFGQLSGFVPAGRCRVYSSYGIRLVSRTLFVTSLLFFSLRGAVITSAFLPKRSNSYISDGVLDHYVRSRISWDIPVAVFIGALLLSFSVYLVLEARGKFSR